MLMQFKEKFDTGFRIPNVRVSCIDEQFQADLAYVSNLSKENDGINYLFFVIDVLSKYL